MQQKVDSCQENQLSAQGFENLGLANWTDPPDCPNPSNPGPSENNYRSCFVIIKTLIFNKKLYYHYFFLALNGWMVDQLLKDRVWEHGFMFLAQLDYNREGLASLPYVKEHFVI